MQLTDVDIARAVNIDRVELRARTLKTSVASGIFQTQSTNRRAELRYLRRREHRMRINLCPMLPRASVGHVVHLDARHTHADDEYEQDERRERDKVKILVLGLVNLSEYFRRPTRDQRAEMKLKGARHPIGMSLNRLSSRNEKRSSTVLNGSGKVRCRFQLMLVIIA